MGKREIKVTLRVADVKYFGLFGEFDDIIDHRRQVVLGHLVPAEGPKCRSVRKQFNVAPERTDRNQTALMLLE